MTANSGSVRTSPHSLLQHELYLNDAYCEFVVRPADAAYVRFNITFDVETASDSVRISLQNIERACFPLAHVYTSRRSLPAYSPIPW